MICRLWIWGSGESLHSYILSISQTQQFDIFSRFDDGLVELLEADVLGVLPEALAAHVEAVFADHTVAVGAGTAEMENLEI